MNRLLSHHPRLLPHVHRLPRQTSRIGRRGATRGGRPLQGRRRVARARLTIQQSIAATPTSGGRAEGASAAAIGAAGNSDAGKLLARGFLARGPPPPPRRTTVPAGGRQELEAVNRWRLLRGRSLHRLRLGRTVGQFARRPRRSVGRLNLPRRGGGGAPHRGDRPDTGRDTTSDWRQPQRWSIQPWRWSIRPRRWSIEPRRWSIPCHDRPVVARARAQLRHVAGFAITYDLRRGRVQAWSRRGVTPR